MPLGTGYEEVLAGRVTEKFAYVAKEDGKVVSIKNDVMKIQYKSGDFAAFEIGRVFTGGEGHTYPNDILATVKAGESFKQGDTLAFNEAWFEQSPYDPKLVSMKHGVPTYVMLCENTNTLEDGSVISPEISRQLNAAETEIRELVFPFNSTIHNLVKEGDKLEPDDILCTIEDVGSAAGGLLSEATVGTLNLLVDNSPRAKVHGQVDYIEVLYNGDLEDMSESVRKLVDNYDKKIRLKMKDLGKNIESGRTDEGQRVGGQPLQIDTLVIRLFISHSGDAVGGNKAVMGNQLKTVHGQVTQSDMVTESGRPIGFQYADVGVENRVVSSPRVWGITNLLLIHAASRTVKAYRGK